MEELRVYHVTDPPPPEEGAEAATPAPRPTFHATSVVTVQLRDVARAQELLTTFGGSDQLYSPSPSPVYSLLDDSAPRRAARAQAIASARADAEAYAAALGMRISRVLRVTERGGLDFLSMLVSESHATREMQLLPFGPTEVQVPTYAVVGVDFVLIPQ